MKVRGPGCGSIPVLLAWLVLGQGWSCARESSGPPGPTDPDAFDPSGVARSFCPQDPDQVEEALHRMSPLQRIGQHLVIPLYRSGSTVDGRTRDRLHRYFPGGGFVSQVTGVAMNDHESTARFLHDVQQAALETSGVPLLVAADQEGGVYSVMQHMMGGTDPLGPTAIGSTGSPWVAFRQFAMMGREIKALGIHADFGPLLDTHDRPDNGNLNTRTFGPDVDLNATLGVAACLGLQHEGVMPVVKHFPGDGMTAGNTHHEFVVNTASRETLEARLLKPFRAAFQAGCDAVMIIPARYDALDATRSAVTSRPVITGLLRGELGFDGLVVTDDLGMHGAIQGLAPGEIPGLEALLDRLAAGSLPVVHVMQGVPFDWWISRGRVAAAIALMGGLPVLCDAGASLMYGDITGTGTMRWEAPR